MVNFHLLGRYGSHFDHRMEQVLKELKFFAIAIKCRGVVVTGLIVIDCGLFWMSARTSANLFNGTWGVSGSSGSGAGRVVSRETLWFDSCLSRFGCERIRPVRN